MMTTINKESYLKNSSKQPIDKRILDRSRSVMINNLGSFLNSVPSISTNPSTWEEDEVDDESRIMKHNPIRGSESRKIIMEIPMYNLKTLGSVLHKRKLTTEVVSERVSQFRKTILEAEAEGEGGGDGDSDSLRKSSVGTTVTWDRSLEFEDCDKKCESSSVEELQWEWYNDEFDQDCMERCFNEKRNGCTATEKMQFDDEEMCGDFSTTELHEHDDWLIEPSDDGVSLPV